jgi:hypothetical protein
MTSVAAPVVKRRDWRGIIFKIVAGLLALFHLAFGALSLLSPWVTFGFGDPAYQEANRWGNTGHGVHFAILIAGTMLALLWRPRSKPLLMQFYTLIAISGILVSALFPNPATGFEWGPVLLFLVLPLVAYPAPRSLLSVSREGPVSKPLLVSGIVATALLVWVSARVLQTYIAGTGTADWDHGHWFGAIMGGLNLMLVALLPATRRPGWQSLGIIAGLAFTYLGIASLSIPYHDGSWGFVGGTVSLLVGLAFLAVTIREVRKMPRTHALS